MPYVVQTKILSHHSAAVTAVFMAEPTELKHCISVLKASAKKDRDRGFDIYAKASEDFATFIEAQLASRVAQSEKAPEKQ